MAFIKQSSWDKYKAIIDEWHEDVFQQEIVWKRNITNLNQYGEDNNVRYEDITLLGLIHYNEFRSWPINMYTDTGELDKQSVMVFFNIEYLKDLGYTNPYGVLQFDHGLDKFVINGVLYKSAGESQVAQAHNHPLLTFIILQREETSSTSESYNYGE